MIIVGVVFRGNLWLDGMITWKLEANQVDSLSLFIQKIIHSKQYSQLRVLILSKQLTSRLRGINIVALANSIRLPVISIVQEKRGGPGKADRGHESRKRGLYKFKAHGAPVFVRVAGIDVFRARQIFEVGRMEPYRIPEAVRVADLIAKRANI
jgi:endonuclease V-like protein UPF0215 family